MDNRQIEQIADILYAESNAKAVASLEPEITKIQKFKLKKLKPEIDERFLEGISGKDLNVVI